MIDIHIIVLKTTNQEWLDICLKSLVHPDVTVHIVEGDGETIGQSRARGYLLGNNPFVCHVDPDDYLLEGAIDLIKPYLDKYGSITTREIIIDESGRSIFVPRDGHQLTVYKRSDITEKLLYCMERTSFTSEMYVKQAIQPKIIPLLTYAYRIHKDGAHHRHSDHLVIERNEWKTAQQEWNIKDKNR